MSLVGFVIKRLIFSVLTLFALSLIVFYATTFFPLAQRVSLFIPTNPYNAPGRDIFSAIPALAKKYGLDQPFYVQYSNWVISILNGNGLGYSWLYDDPVIDVIRRRFPATLELVLFSAPIIVFGGYRLGVFMAKRAYKAAPKDDPADFAMRSISILGYSITQFCIAMILIVIFYSALGWLELGRLGWKAKEIVISAGWVHYTESYVLDSILNGNITVLIDALVHLLLPVMTLTLSMLPIIARMTRSAMLGELGMPYVLMAKAKGLSENEAAKHAEKNSLSSVITVSGILLATMLTGVVVTESVFSLDGVGSMVVEAARRYDFALLTGTSMIFCLIFALVNLVVEVWYARVDPRITL